MIKKRFCKCWINVRKEPDTYTGTSLKVRLYPDVMNMNLVLVTRLGELKLRREKETFSCKQHFLKLIN